MTRSQRVGPGARQKESVRLVQTNASRRRVHEVFGDFCELGALSISNSVDRLQFGRREARYLKIVARYSPEEVARFPAMLGELVQMFEEGFDDHLGGLFMQLELGNHWKGQFFTPYSVASAMASMTLVNAREQIEREGFITINEPACGAGAMVIACADALHAQGINYQQVMHVTAQDIDATAAHMAYIQLSLMHIPAQVVEGNSIAMTDWAHWLTPAHVLGGWDWRLCRRARQHQAAKEPLQRHQVPAAPARRAPAPIETAVLREQLVRHQVEQMQLFG